jgi:hypothetical protein
MAAITMALIHSLIDEIKAAYPRLVLRRGDNFYYNASAMSITYDPSDRFVCQLLLHEIGHYIAADPTPNSGVELIACEQRAWFIATSTLSPRFEVKIDKDFVEDCLDTYRHWLHQRSTCSYCNITALEFSSSHYTCVACGRSWLANSAKTCRLKKTSLKA